MPLPDPRAAAGVPTVSIVCRFPRGNFPFTGNFLCCVRTPPSPPSRGLVAKKWGLVARDRRPVSKKRRLVAKNRRPVSKKRRLVASNWR